MNQLEQRIIELSYRHQLTHVSSCLNCVNLLDWVYDQRKPDEPVVMDNGHAALAHYVVLEKHGLCDAEEMVKKHGTHASRDMEHGIWVSNGSLGQAATVAVGMALADKNRIVWLVTSDGSCIEGATREALRVGDKHCPNLRVMIVFNGYGAYGEITHGDLPTEGKIYYVDIARYPKWLRGLNGHYLKLDTDSYIELLELRILCRDAFAYFYKHLGDYEGNYLEIGVFEGFMLRELSKAYPSKMFYGIDPFIEDGHTTGHTGIQKGERLTAQMATTHSNIAGRPNIVFHEQTSRSWNEQLTDDQIEKMNISAVLVDGDHSYEEASNDMRIALRCLKKGGVMYVDDQGLEQVQRATDDFSKQFSDRISWNRGNIIIVK